MPAESREDIQPYLDAVGSISAVPAMLRLISDHTKMRFSAIARVTDTAWTACAVHDTIGMGLVPGSELPVDTTLCIEARACRQPVAMDHASQDPLYRNHQTPRLYKFESYVSVPIVMPDGSYFGNLCALDPLPQSVSQPSVVAMFEAYAGLLAQLLANESSHGSTVQALEDERSLGVSREHMIAVVAHDLRNPLSAVASGCEVVARFGEAPLASVGERMKKSVRRMAGLLDDLVDFSRARQGEVIVVDKQLVDLAGPIADVIYETKDFNPRRHIIDDVRFDRPVSCDAPRIQQLVSNLLGNAIAYGSATEPVLVQGRIEGDAMVVLSVLNRGDVIPPADLGHLFDAFWRGESEGGKRVFHMGLGLHICSLIVRAHGGTLSATSSEENGTRFEARWPVA